MSDKIIYRRGPERGDPPKGYHYDYEGDPRYCGKRADAAGVEVACWRPFGHVEDYHQGPRSEGEQFTWNPSYIETMPPRR